LTPNDWWWHTKCGMLAIPMSALKRYKWVIFSIALTAFILGGLWHVQEAFRHIFTIDLIEDTIIDYNNWRAKTFVYVFGALIAVPIIWNGEKIVDCLGHSNIFILAFISFALRFGGLYFENEDSLVTLYEIFEPVSFYLSWFALLLFIRHLVPKKFLALGQGLLVILFFALGRAFGFFFGVSVISEPRHIEVLKQNATAAAANQVIDLQNIHSTATVIAFTAALIYFVIYHLILLPRYKVPTNRLDNNNDSNVSPQRVFHDERSRKGYFRY
jgi:MFS_1 like family